MSEFSIEMKVIKKNFKISLNLMNMEILRAKFSLISGLTIEIQRGFEPSNSY
jgi:hypothetical protein